ncbi:MAG: M64 family metallopeptidase [Bacteroidaceae bacterium]
MCVRRITLVFAVVLIGMAGMCRAQNFDDWFQDQTLRLDYTFSGDSKGQQIYLDEMRKSDGWYGRRVHLDSLLLQGNGQITVADTMGVVLYRHSFSTLFQEWQVTREAMLVKKSFENVFLVPMPKVPVDITISLFDTHRQVCGSMKHRVDPADILIRPVRERCRWEYLRSAGDSRGKIDIVFVAEGYQQAEMNVFRHDCQETIDALLSHEPFLSMADRFNFIAVYAPSEDSGVSIPHDGLWKRTATSSHFDTFYSERYLTTLHLKQLHDLLSGIPYEHIVILANTDNYGGGGIFNSYMLSAAHHPTCKPVAVHEFGHSFAGLGDEYYYDDQYDTLYPADTEPWEPNLTTLVDFSSKWKDMMPHRASIPTQPSGKNLYSEVGVYEGGGYQSKGVYRPSQECRMKINESPVFCPVCRRAIARMIDYQTK